MDSVDHLLPESGKCSDLGAHGQADVGTAKAATGSSPLELVVSHPRTGVCVVRVAGELDTWTAPALADCVRKQLSTGARCLVIDLEAVRFLASAGLGALLESSRALAETVPGAMIHLSGTSHRVVRRPLEVVGILPLFIVHLTLDDALSSITATEDSTAPNL